MLLFVVQTLAEAQPSTLTRHVREAVRSGEAWLVDRLPADQTLRLDLVLPLRDQPGLEQFLQAVYDPSNPSYRHFLTVSEFTARFGPSQDDYDAVVHFAKSHGLTMVGGSRDGMDIQVEAPVSSIETVFHVSMGVYQHPAANRTFYSPDREPTVDLPFPLWHISGLDNYSLPHALVKKKNPGSGPSATTGSGPGSSFLGSDMRAAYYGGTALTGSGQNIGLLEFYGYEISDLNTYYTNAHQTLAAAVTGVSTDGTSLNCVYPVCDDTEQILDMTQALGMAPGVSTLYVFVGSSDTAILGAMASHSPLPLQLSSSWTWTPVDPGTDDPYFQKMAAQGQSFFQASGDSDAWSRSNDLYPSEDPNVICVGGTDLTTSSAGGPWSSEVGWVDGGGGISPDNLPIPSWQQLSGVINSSNEGSTSYRNGPDVSANANFTFYVCADQTTCTANEYGGTSFASPMWAGYAALANQQAAANGQAAIGFINPAVYSIGVSSSYNTDFHDITSGNNGFPAVTGYDLDTGWGSPNGANLINALTAVSSSPNFTISASPASVSVQQGSNGASTITTTITGGFNSAIALSASGQPAGVTVTFNPTSIAAPGSGSSSMTIAVSSTTTTGTYSITVTGTGEGINNSTTVTLTVTAAARPNFSLSASPASVSVQQGSNGASTITATITGGFNSAIALSASGQPAGVTVAFNPTSIAAPGSGSSSMTIAVSSTTTTGTYSITVTGTGGGINNSTTVTLTVTAAASANFSLSASPASITVLEGGSNSTTITSTVSGGFDAAVALSASGLPSGVTATFTPSSIAAPGSGTSTVTFKAGSHVSRGTFNVTITGNGGGKTNTTKISLTVKK